MTKKLNKIEKLITELCPEGVEFKELGGVCDIADNKRKPVKASLRVTGDIPYYGANNIQDYVEGFTHNGDFVLIAEDGSASLENYSIQFASGKFWANNHVHVVTGLEGLNNRFLFHYLKNMDFVPYLTGLPRAKLTRGKMGKIKIPIPPIKVQEAIVKVLDTFTELEAELEARKKQYEYYRDEMLTFAEGEVEWKELGEVCDISTGQKPIAEINLTMGKFPFINAGLEPSGYFIEKNTNSERITIPSRGQGGAGHVGYQKTEFWCGSLCYRLFSKNETHLTKFIYYYLKSIQEKIIGLRKTGSIPAVNKTDLSLIKIPTPYKNGKPDLEKQKQIVEVLDKFDALVNDISIGLPAELKARRQQYEYYREKLLTFTPLDK